MNPAETPDPGDPATFMVRAARVLSGARRESMFEDLTRAAAELLGANIGLLGRYVEQNGIPCISTLACCVDGEMTPNKVYPLAGTPCETVVGQEFRFYPDRVAYLFPESPAKDNEIAGYAAFPLFDDDGSRLGIFTVMSKHPLQDAARAESLLRIFSERAVAEIHRIEGEEALRASEERYRAIFNAAVDGLGLLSPEGTIIDVNVAAERLYGYTREEMVGQKAVNFARGPSRENAANFLTAVRENDFAIMVDKAVRRDGSEFFIEPRGVTVEYQNRPHLLVVIRDVTERVASEQQRAKLEGQLRQAQKMEAIGHLTGGIAHDFNNILTSVLGYVELAHEHVAAMADVKLNRYLERAQRSGERARDLIRQMLTFSRGQHGEASAGPVGPAIDDAITLLESMMPSTIKISRDIAADLPYVVHDPVHLEQVLVNLCLNARDAMVDGGTLEVILKPTVCSQAVCSSCHLEVTGEFVELAVADAGTGMAPALVERIFEPFFSTKETGKGSGMGLSTVHGIVHEYGGHLLVQSEPEVGTRMRVLLPVVPGENRGKVEAREQLRPVSSTPGLRGNVLLVDDNTEVAEFVAELLNEWGLETTVFNDGEAALKHFLARADAYELAILDQTMPAVTGIKLARLMLRQRPGFPIILYTGHSDSVDDDSARTAGVHTFLRKPLDLIELRSAIEAILDGPGG